MCTPCIKDGGKINIILHQCSHSLLPVEGWYDTIIRKWDLKASALDRKLWLTKKKKKCLGSPVGIQVISTYKITSQLEKLKEKKKKAKLANWKILKKKKRKDKKWKCLIMKIEWKQEIVWLAIRFLSSIYFKCFCSTHFSKKTK